MRPARGGRRLLALGLAFLVVLPACAGQGGEEHGSESDSPSPAAATAPMEEKERAALYAAIESFVGKGWNGSGLYPDPCGWSPIQVRASEPVSSLPHCEVVAMAVLLCCVQTPPHSRLVLVVQFFPLS
jgi:hypothetical protein